MAIDINEIRLNNWVKYADYKNHWINILIGQPVQVDIDIFIEAYSHPELYDYCDLTPKLLEQCGFEFISNWTCKDKRKHDCVYFYDLGYLYIAMNILGGITLFQNNNLSTGIHFNHLHHLQNTVRDLTGKELPITLSNQC